MHAGRLETSKKQQETLLLLMERGSRGATTLEIQRRTGSMSPATNVSELRQNGHHIDCVYDYTADTGSRVFRYFYRGKP